MSTVTKFTFDLDFDAPEEPEVPEAVEEEEEPEEVIPTFSEEEVEQARAEGFEAGKEEGRREAADATEQKLLETIEAACTKIGDIYNTQNEANREIGREMISVAAAIAKKMFPDLNARNALGEVERVVQETLKAVTEEPRIQIMVNPELREPLTERLGTMTHRAGFEGKVFVNPDPSMALGDCRIEWSNGAAVRDGEELWQMIEEIIEHNLHGPAEIEDEDTPTSELERNPEPVQAEPDHDGGDTASADDAPAAPQEESAEDSPEETTEGAQDVEPAVESPEAEAEDLAEAEAPDAAVETATEEVTADENPSWEAATSESAPAEIAPAPEPEAAMAPEVDEDDSDVVPASERDDLDEHSFTPSFDPDEVTSDEQNADLNQELTDDAREAPIPHLEDYPDTAPSDSADADDERPAPVPVSDPDPVSPETQAAILDAQSAMTDEDDTDTDRDPSGG
jgi:flagellar assembly protein FliH